MPRYNIYNQASAIDLGTYEAADSDGALDLMAQAAGYSDAAHMREKTGADPGLIVSLVGLNGSPDAADIVARREAAGLSQAKAALMIGVSMRTIQYWEAGQHQMEPELWQRFNERTERLVKS